MGESYPVEPIGWVESELVDPAQAPKQGPEGGREVWLNLRSELASAIADIQEKDELLVFTWLHRADRTTLAVHPRDDARNPLTGVFSTRSADRPNPIGLHPVTVTAVEGNRIRVEPMEAIDGTPVVDIKPEI